MLRRVLVGVVTWVVLGSPRPAPADDAQDKVVRLVEGLGGTVVRDDKPPGRRTARDKPAPPDAPVREVHLNGTPVTDDDLTALAGLPHLMAVFLYDTRVSDAGVKNLAGVKGLTHLDLRNTRVTDAGVKALARQHPKLFFLNLGGTRLTDAGLKEVGKLGDLYYLTLSDQVTDAGLKELAGLKQLHGIILNGPGITDAGLKELAGLKTLTQVGMNRTNTTDAGVEAFRKVLPKCRIP